jgi:hypothetical protein
MSELGEKVETQRRGTGTTSGAAVQENFPAGLDCTGVLPQNSSVPDRQIGVFDRIYEQNGSLYIPFHSVPVAAGPFLPTSMDWVEQHLRVPPEEEFHHGIRDQYVNGRRTHRSHLGAGRVQGDSMIDRGIYDRDVIVFQHSFENVEHGRILVIEKVGEEEGWGAWSLKRLIIEQPRSSSLDEYGEEIDREEPVVVLRSCNRRVNPWQLSRSGRYRIRGVLLRWLRPEDVELVESESLSLAVADEKVLPSRRIRRPYVRMRRTEVRPI